MKIWPLTFVVPWKSRVKPRDFSGHNNGVADRMSDHTRRSWVCGNKDKMFWGAAQDKETKRPTKRRGRRWNYWHVPRNSWVRSNPESFDDGLPKKYRRTDFQRNWRGDKKEYQTKEKVCYRWKNKVSGNNTGLRWFYCTIHTPIERKS